MKKYARWIVMGGVLVALVASYGWASSPGAEPMTPRASEAWSRGQIVGQTLVKRPPSLRPAPGGGIYLVWPNLDGRLELARVGGDGEILLDRVLPVGTRKARDPQLTVGRDGRLHLLWREHGGSRVGVQYALLEPDGTPVGQPQILSDPDDWVLGVPRLIQGAEGRLNALWADDAGIHRAILDAEGGIAAGPALLIPEGHSLLVQMDDAARLHLVWQQEVRISTRGVYYAVLDSGAGELGNPVQVAEIVLNDRIQLEDVAFGLGHDLGYVLWSQRDEGFDRYMFEYVSFSLHTPEERQAGLWDLKIGDGPKAIAFPDGQWSPLPAALCERIIGLGPDEEPDPGSDLAHYLIRNEGAYASGKELMLQITLITLGEGQDGSIEQIVTASPRASLKPILAVDSRSHMHLAWLETGGFGQYKLVYASTAPEVLKRYNALTPWEVANLVFSRLFRLSVVVVAAVSTFITWAIVPLVGLTVYHLATSEEALTTTRGWVALVAVLAVEVALAFALPPRMAGMETALPVLRWGVPSIAVAVAMVVTTKTVRRRGDAHLFATFFLFTFVNILLQTSLYLLL